MLDSIHTPADLRKQPPDELTALAEELRQFLLHSIAASGGHFSAGLGVVELTIALHYVFNTPKDDLIWDVGHQAYAHKVLTGRRDQLANIRKKGGLSGFPKRSESEYDSFGVGHSSTSISAALGMALAAKHQGEDKQSVAIIGDGAMTAGMAYEAMNHAGDVDADLLVILNDNNMSISPNVGGLRSYLSHLLTGRFYSKLRENSKRMLSSMPSLSRLVKLTEEHMKGMVLPGTFFEEMGFKYYGPIDGHDVNELVKILSNIKKIKGPRILHIVTKKGKGYAAAEKDPCLYHGVSRFDLKQGIVKSPPSSPTYTQVFGQWLCDIAAQDPRIIAITPAMREGSGLVEFSHRFPERYYDVAIAEQHAVTLAAGFACKGMKPIVAIYSSFLQRAYDQVIHDVGIQNLAIVFAIDRAGLVGADGATHSGNYDISFLRCIPNFIVMVAADENECRQMLYTAYLCDCPVAVRYPRGKGIGITPEKTMQAIEIGIAQRLRQTTQKATQTNPDKTRTAKTRIAILLFGSLLNTAQAVAEKLDASLVNMRFVKPLDQHCIADIAATHELIVTLEDNAIMGGAGSAVNEYLHQIANTSSVLNLGLPDEYIHHAERDEQLAACGLNPEGIIAKIKHFLA